MKQNLGEWEKQCVKRAIKNKLINKNILAKDGFVKCAIKGYANG